MAFEGLRASLFPMAILTLFWKQELGLSMFQIMLVQGFFGLGMVVFEFPSGYLADRLGYRNTLALASLLAVAGSALYCRVAGLPGVVTAEFILGLATSLVSGADSALLYESLRVDGKEGEFSRWAALRQSVGQTAEGAAALVAGALYASWMRLPFALQVVVWSLALGLSWRLAEPPRQRPPRGGHLPQVRRMVRHVAVDNRPLRAVLVTTVIFSLASFLPVWIVQIYAADAGVPYVWLGPVWSAASFAVVAGAAVSRFAERRLGLKGLLLVATALTAAGYLGLGATDAIWGFAFYWLITGMRGLFSPVLHHQEQRLIPSPDRAGFLSLRSLVFRLSVLVLGPPVGLLIDLYGAHRVFLGLGAVLTAAALAATAWCARALARSPGDRPAIAE